MAGNRTGTCGNAAAAAADTAVPRVAKRWWWMSVVIWLQIPQERNGEFSAPVSHFSVKGQSSEHFGYTAVYPVPASGRAVPLHKM
mmetsp:Transcript_27181/g.58965  ORF Transcript_27181/g.58965 Transcript_27181/m.58965 type:complete len:85 (+) Transcript_27181:1142-1396(+)